MNTFLNKPAIALIAALALQGVGVPAMAQDAAPEAAPDVEELGDGRYRIGEIEVDKNAARFSIPGEVIKLEPPQAPLEFLAVSRGGPKRYEALFELASDAISFNLACILIGLDDANATHPEYHFDPEPVQGDPVTVEVEWQHDGEVVRLPAVRTLRLKDDTPGEHGDWVYTGSILEPGGVYKAQVAGTLIGFVHDTDSIIQHRAGLGLGDYGAVTANRQVLPPPGTPVTVLVQRREE